MSDHPACFPICDSANRECSVFLLPLLAVSFFKALTSYSLSRVNGDTTSECEKTALTLFSWASSFVWASCESGRKPLHAKCNCSSLKTSWIVTWHWTSNVLDPSTVGGLHDFWLRGFHWTGNFYRTWSQLFSLLETRCHYFACAVWSLYCS